MDQVAIDIIVKKGFPFHGQPQLINRIPGFGNYGTIVIFNIFGAIEDPLQMRFRQILKSDDAAQLGRGDGGHTLVM